MDKEQAERALSIIRGVIENTREDLIAHNWGAIWLVHAFTNSLSFASIGYFVERRGLPVYWYLVPLAIVAAVNLLIVAVLAHRDRGVRSFIEWQMHGIWITFIVFTLAGAAFLHLANASPALFCPLIATTSGIGFSMMGVVFTPRFFGLAAMYVLVALIAPLISVAGAQWYLLALAWWAAMFVPGLIMTREKLRRQRDERATKIL